MTRVRQHVQAEHRSVVATVLDALPMQICSWDRDLRLRYANQAALENPALDLAARRSLHDSAAEALLAPALSLFERALKGHASRYERSASTADGEPVDIVADIAPIRVADTVVGVRVIGTALSRGVRARSRLRAERDQLGDALSTGPQSRLRTVMRDLATLPRDVDRLETAAVSRILGELDAAVGDLRRVIAELRGVPSPASPSETPKLEIPVVPPRATSDDRPGVAESAGESWEAADEQVLFDSLPAAGAWGPEARCIVLNAQARRSFGLGPRAEVAGRAYRSIAGDALADVNEPVIRVALDGLPIASRLEYVDAQRVRRKGLVRYAPVRHGVERWAVGALLDVGDLLDADDAAEEAAAELAADRQHIAADLHDHAIQLLYAAGLTMKSVADGTSADLRESLNNAVLCVAEALLRVHATVGTLTREHADDVEEAVRRIARRSTGALGFEPRVDVVGSTRALPSEVVDDLAAVLREALSNVARHARATQAHVVLSAGPDAVVLRVADDGVGLGSPTRTSGLNNMADRAARHHGVFDVRANEPRGTVVDWRARF